MMKCITLLHVTTGQFQISEGKNTETRIPISKDRKFTASEKSQETISKYETTSNFTPNVRITIEF
jgi:hypothetical protein